MGSDVQRAETRALAAAAEAAFGRGAGFRSLRLPGGRTSAVYRLTAETGAEAICKLSDPGSATPLFDNDPDQEWAALRALAPLGLSAQPLARQHFEDRVILLSTVLPPLSAPPEPQAVARQLFRLHRIPPWEGLPACAAEPDALLAAGDAMLSRLNASAWIRALRPSPAALAPTPTVPIHRDPIPANLAGQPEAPVFVDWQCPGLGDPCEDLAHASSAAMGTVYADAGGALDEAALLAGYPDAGIRARYWQIVPAYRWRMLCYCQWQAERGQAIYAAAAEAEAAALEEAHNQRDRTG